MSRTGQNLCNDVISTVYKSTFSSQRKINIKREENTSKSSANRLTSNQNKKGWNSNKVASKRVSGQSKSKEKVSKCNIDFGVNTLISGPKLCNSDCTTSIKSGGNQHLCKCGRKVKFKMVDNGTQYIETLHCSTQCPNKCSIKTNTNYSSHQNTYKKSQAKPLSIEYSSIKQPASFVIYENPKPKNTYKTKYPIHLAINRWAISRHPIRGPDF